MWDRIRVGRSQGETLMIKGAHLRPKRRSRSQPMVEVLEDRQLMTASLQPITNLTVPAQQGYTLPLLSGSTATPADDPDLHDHLQQPGHRGEHCSRTILEPRRQLPRSSTPASSPFTGTLTFQLFQNLTPNTVSEITNLSNAGIL